MFSSQLILPCLFPPTHKPGRGERKGRSKIKKKKNTKKRGKEQAMGGNAHARLCASVSYSSLILADLSQFPIFSFLPFYSSLLMLPYYHIPSIHFSSHPLQLFIFYAIEVFKATKTKHYERIASLLFRIILITLLRCL